MSDEFDLDQYDDGSEGFKSLRKALKKYQQENETLKSENATLKTTEAKTQMNAAFSKHNIDPKFLPLYTDEDRSDEAIGRWAEMYGFAKQAEETPPAEAGETVVPGEEQKAYAAVAAAGSGGGGGQASLSDRIANTKNPAELAQLIAERRNRGA